MKFNYCKFSKFYLMQKIMCVLIETSECEDNLNILKLF